MKLPRAFFGQFCKQQLRKPPVRRLIILTGIVIICFSSMLPFIEGQKQASNITTTTLKPPTVSSKPKVTAGSKAPKQLITTAASTSATAQTVPGPSKTTVHAKTTEYVRKPLTLDSLKTPLKGDILRGTSKGLIWWETLADYRQHIGQDISAPVGTKVFASETGLVSELGTDPVYGNVVVISHADGWKTVYGQLAKIAVKLKSTVKKGELLGEVGQPSGGEGNLPSHLHYEILHLEGNNPFQVRN